MFTSFDPILGQSAADPTAGTNLLNNTSAAATTTDPLGSQFQDLLMQLLTQLLKRLEASVPLAAQSGQAATTASSAANVAGSQANLTTPVWILPGPANTLSPTTVQQAYAPLANTTTAVTPASVAAPSTPAEAVAPAASVDLAAAGILPISDFPHPLDDNGRGMHWIPTVSSTPAVVDKFVGTLKAMHVKWVTILNDGSNASSNDYLVQQLKANGMEPVMRVYTPGLQPIDGDLGAMVRHYKSLGVSYFQLYNEPNISSENDGKAPDVKRYLDLWVPAAKIVAANGGLPGFGALSPGGEYKDTAFLSDAVDQLKARGELGTLDHAWLDIHNYQGNRDLTDTAGFSRYKVYADTLQQKLGRLMPMVGTEGGTFTDSTTNESQRTGLVTDTFRYMEQREPYNFAYSYWVIANQAGGGHDPAWEWQALVHPDGQSPLVDALDNLA